VRGELVPLLAERFNPSIVDTLAGEAALLRDLWLWAEEASRPFFTVPGSLDVVSLRAAPLALRRLVVWRAMAAASEGRSISFEHVAAAIRLIDAGEDGEGRRIDVPGHTVQRIGGRLVLTNRRHSPVSRKADANLFRLPLSIPGEVQIPGTRSVVSAEDAPASCAEAGNGAVAVVRRDRVQGSLVVRNRRPGDRFRPVGLGGSKKLQDLFVDRKLPLLERDRVPLVVDGTDRIVWVAGYGIDEAFRVTDPSQAVLVLRLTRA
jgi:tRNA(Ile)-lysidine synthase